MEVLTVRVRMVVNPMVVAIVPAQTLVNLVVMVQARVLLRVAAAVTVQALVLVHPIVVTTVPAQTLVSLMAAETQAMLPWEGLRQAPMEVRVRLHQLIARGSSSAADSPSGSGTS